MYIFCNLNLSNNMSTQSNEGGNPKEVRFRPNKNTPEEVVKDQDNHNDTTPPPPPLSPQMFIVRELEKFAEKIPSRVFLYGSAGLMALAVSLKYMNNRKAAVRVGQFAVPCFMWGVYKEIVKPKTTEE